MSIRFEPKGFLLGVVAALFFLSLLVLSSFQTRAMLSPSTIVYSNGSESLSLRAVREGYDRVRNNYWAKYEIKVIKGQVQSFKIEVGKFYCTVTYENSVCVGNPGTKEVLRPTFKLSDLKKENDAYVLYIGISPIDGRHCGSFQSDLRIIAINGKKVTSNLEKQVYTNCSLAQDGKFNCGLPLDWQANCSQPTPTPPPYTPPTPTPTPTPILPSAPTNTPIPTPSPQPATIITTSSPPVFRQNISQEVNVNQEVNIQQSSNRPNNQQVLGVSTSKPTPTPKIMPKTGSETITLVFTTLSAIAGIYLKRKGL